MECTKLTDCKVKSRIPVTKSRF